MQTDDLRSRIVASKLLTAREKQYWTDNLEALTERQTAKLDRILREAESIEWTMQAEAYISVIAKGQAPAVA